MLHSFLVGNSGPIWAEIAAAAIDKALVAGALTAVGNPKSIQKIYNAISSSPATEENSPNVINIFDEDANK